MRGLGSCCRWWKIGFQGQDPPQIVRSPQVFVRPFGASPTPMLSERNTHDEHDPQ